MDFDKEFGDDDDLLAELPLEGGGASANSLMSPVSHYTPTLALSGSGREGSQAQARRRADLTGGDVGAGVNARVHDPMDVEESAAVPAAAPDENALAERLRNENFELKKSNATLEGRLGRLNGELQITKSRLEKSNQDEYAHANKLREVQRDLDQKYTSRIKTLEDEIRFLKQERDIQESELGQESIHKQSARVKTEVANNRVQSLALRVAELEKELENEKHTHAQARRVMAARRTSGGSTSTHSRRNSDVKVRSAQITAPAKPRVQTRDASVQLVAPREPLFSSTVERVRSNTVWFHSFGHLEPSTRTTSTAATSTPAIADTAAVTATAAAASIPQPMDTRGDDDEGPIPFGMFPQKAASFQVHRSFAFELLECLAMYSQRAVLASDVAALNATANNKQDVPAVSATPHASLSSSGAADKDSQQWLSYVGQYRSFIQTTESVLGLVMNGYLPAKALLPPLLDIVAMETRQLRELIERQNKMTANRHLNYGPGTFDFALLEKALKFIHVLLSTDPPSVDELLGAHAPAQIEFKRKWRLLSSPLPRAGSERKSSIHANGESVAPTQESTRLLELADVLVALCTSHNTHTRRLLPHADSSGWYLLHILLILAQSSQPLAAIEMLSGSLERGTLQLFMNRKWTLPLRQLTLDLLQIVLSRESNLRYMNVLVDRGSSCFEHVVGSLSEGVLDGTVINGLYFRIGLVRFLSFFPACHGSVGVRFLTGTPDEVDQLLAVGGGSSSRTRSRSTSAPMLSSSRSPTLGQSASAQEKVKHAKKLQQSRNAYQRMVVCRLIALLAEETANLHNNPNEKKSAFAIPSHEPPSDLVTEEALRLRLIRETFALLRVLLPRVTNLEQLQSHRHVLHSLLNQYRTKCVHTSLEHMASGAVDLTAWLEKSGLFI